jgi:transcriptional regulator with XRE-family HTH domain
MPKKPEIECPLRKLREITGKSQTAFARVLGCSPSTIKKIEAGDSSKLNPQLLLAASFVFGITPNSLVPPSTELIKLMDGQPFTKEFYDRWWNASPDLMRPVRQQHKEWMVRDLEMVLAAAMRVPGMGFGAVMNAFLCWTRETMTNFQLFPHYETEWNERIKRARKKPNKIQADWESVRLFAENKSKFIQEASVQSND